MIKKIMLVLAFTFTLLNTALADDNVQNKDNNIEDTSKYANYLSYDVKDLKCEGSDFAINIAKGTAKFYSTVQGGDTRDSTGGSTKNYVDIGAGREGGGRPHFGTDTIAKPGTFIVAGEDGTLNIISSPDLPGINIKTDDGIVHQTLYVQPLLKNKTRVEQDDVIGKVVDITVAEKYKHTINHVHEEIIEYGNGYIEKKDGTVKKGIIKYNVYDSNQILYPNSPNSNENKEVNEYIKRRQQELKLKYEQQQNNKNK